MPWRVGLAFFIAAAFCVHPDAASWNVTSRLATVESLVDRGTFAIDRSSFKTGDEYYYDGHFYSDKPVVLSVAGAVVVEVFRIAKIDIVRDRRVLLTVLTIATVSLPFGIAMATFAALVRRLIGSARDAAAIAIVAGSSTLAFPYATVLINHVPAACCLLIGIAIIVRRPERWPSCMIAGGALALAVGIDSSYALFLLLAPIVIGGAPPMRYLSFIVGALAVLAPLAACDLALSGDIRPPDVNASLYAYPGSPFAHGYIIGTIGSRSIADIARYAFDVTLGDRGLFLYSPILLMAAYGLIRGLRHPSTPIVRRVFLFTMVASVAYVASVIFGTTDYGGEAYGLRRFVGIELLMCLGFVAIWTQLRTVRSTRRIFLGLFALSLAIVALGVRDPLVAGPFPARDAIPILVSYGRALPYAAVTGALVVAGLASAAFRFVALALPSTESAAVPAQVAI